MGLLFKRNAKVTDNQLIGVLTKLNRKLEKVFSVFNRSI